MANLKRGFTLIELLVVIAIIALLMSILMPALGRAKELSRRVVCASGLKQIGIATRVYSYANDDKLPDSGNERHAYVAYRDSHRDSNGKLRPYRWAYLYEEGLIDNPKIFYCASNRQRKRQYKSYISPGPWGTLPQDSNSGNQWVRIGYTYFPIEEGSTVDPAGTLSNNSITIATKFSKLYPLAPIATDVIGNRGNLSHQADSNITPLESPSNRYTINALFPDTSVISCNDKAVFGGSMSTIWSDMEQALNNSHSVEGYKYFNFMVFRAISR